MKEKESKGIELLHYACSFILLSMFRVFFFLLIALLRLLPHLIVAIKYMYVVFNTRYVSIARTYVRTPRLKIAYKLLFPLQDKLTIIVSFCARIWTTEGSQDCLRLATPTLQVAVGPGPSRGRQQTAAGPILGTFETCVTV